MHSNDTYDLTIIIPFYNTINYINDTLISINQQFIPKNIFIQVLVINDGSSQDISTHLKTINHPNISITLHTKPNGNWGSVVNYVKQHKLALGKYITILDSDDALDKKCLTHFFNVTANIGADIVLGNFAYWNGKNRCKKIKTILNIRSKKWNISTKNINKFKTPYLMPLGKFYARQIFYQIKNLSEHTYYQDVNLYYQSLFLAKNIYFINKNLALYRSNRKDSSSNMNWSEKKLNNWINTITFINNHDNAIGGIFYLLVKGFKNAYTLKYSQPLKIKGKIKVTYLPKIFYVPIWIFIKIILFSYRRVLILAK